ncbi:hypothetical protein RBU49_09780 [Clostridium sp. MB40-C1]|uniref:DUF6985 domain-containing protein n=1 Tax=Clostridium sp. MB40-C1 TaxID=3070996 RepID=UPI0027E193C2|nr:hypothetical protein [Clostridium sp. MB40-C1]WMJ79179.1 hypothetical protein RBU49_09780 [Clostridium sp. MB40-C1]
MINNITKTNYGLEGTVEFKLFNTAINVLMDKDIDLEYANLCAKSLNNLDDRTINKLCEFSILYCNDFCDDIGEEPPKFNAVKDVLNYIQPNCLIIDTPKDNSKPVIHLELNCDWEIEHGLEWTINDGKILYVGSFNAEDGWSDPSYYEKISWNYAFSK